MPHISWRRGLLHAAGWAVLLGALVVLPARWADSGRRSVVTLAAFLPYAVLPVAVALVLFLLLRARAGALAAAVVLLLHTSLQLPTGLGGAAVPPDALVVVTANIKLGQAAAGVPAVVEEAGADLVSVQELTPEAVDELERTSLARDFPHTALLPGPTGTGIGLWSKRPLYDVREIGGFDYPQLAARLQLGDAPSPDDPTVLALHMVSPWPDEAWRWADDHDRLAELLADVTGPVIAAGDFNATRDHAPFRQALAAGGFADAASEAGAGVVRTYPSGGLVPPLLGIDHVVTRGFDGLRARTAYVDGADHRALVVTLAPER